jgi:hypothetical protein
MKGKTCAHTCPHVYDIGLCHLTRATRVPLHLPWCQLPPPGSGQLECRHVSVALAPESRLRAARVLPRVPWSYLPPPDIGWIQSRHVSRGSNSRLMAQGSSGAATCPIELYGLWAIEVNKYPPVTLRSSSPIVTCTYLSRRHTTRPIPHACETCSRWHIKC